MNKTAIKFYSLTNDETGKIVLTPAGEILNKPARSRELVAEIDRLKKIITEQDALLSEAATTICRLCKDIHPWHKDCTSCAEIEMYRNRPKVEPDSGEEDT